MNRKTKYYLITFFLFALPLQQVSAHALDPGFLKLDISADDIVNAYWVVPDVSGTPLPIKALLPTNCETRSGPEPVFSKAKWVTKWSTFCQSGLTGKAIEIAGLNATRNDVIVLYQPAEKQSITVRLTPGDNQLTIPSESTRWETFKLYTKLGFQHILEGWDHLLFLFALILLIRTPLKLIGAITAFTVAHSITLAASSFGWINLKPQPVEAIIALSIIFLSYEIVRKKTDSLRLSERYPWLITFTFGLLHGFGFAGALREIGLPEDQISVALFAFNIGVELGQLTFWAATFLIVMGSLKLIKGYLTEFQQQGIQLGSYVIGGTACFWLIERMMT